MYTHRYNSPLITKECDIFEYSQFPIECKKYILAHMDDCYFLYYCQTDTDPLLVVISDHLSLRPQFAKITAEVFHTLLAAEDESQYHAIFSCNQFRCRFGTTQAEQNTYKNIMLRYITTHCNCITDVVVIDYHSEQTLLFDLSSISVQMYKYAFVYSYGDKTSYLIRGINIYKIDPHCTNIRDPLLMEHEFTNLFAGNAEHALMIFSKYCNHKDIPEEFASACLTIRTPEHFERYIMQWDLSDEEEIQIRQIFSMNSHKENYATSIENLRGMLDLPRVIFNIVLEYL